MSNFRSIFKLQLVNMFRHDRSDGKSKKGLATLIAISVSYVLIAAMLVYVVWLMGTVFSEAELQSEFLTLILIGGLFFVLIFGIVTVLTGLYFSKDTEFFLALPVKPSVVFAAKLAVVYLTELCVTAAVMIPCLITAGIVMEMPAVFYIIMPFAAILTPAIPLFLASIISIPIMYIVSFMKNRGAIGSIAVLILFGVFFGAYYFGISKLQNVDFEQMDISVIRNAMVVLSNTLYPLYALSRAMTLTPVFGLGSAASVAVNLLIYAGSIAAVGSVALLISAAVYRRGAAGQLEGAKRDKVSNVEFKSSGTVKALMKKEWREVLRTPAFALNCLLGIVVCPLIVVFIWLTQNSYTAIEDAGGTVDPSSITLFGTIMRYIMLVFIMFMSVGTNAGPSTTFSREGEKFYYCKMLPVAFPAQVKAKSYVYFIIECISSILGIAAVSIMDFDIVFLICSVLFVIIFNYGSVNMAMLLDLRRPKLKWVTPNEAVKHNRNVVFTMLFTLLASAVLAVTGISVYIIVFSRLGEIAATAISWFLMFIIVSAYAVLSTAFLYKDCEKYLDAIEL